MKQIRIERATVRRERPGREVLPRDARDPDVVRAKALLARARRSRRRATGRAVAQVGMAGPRRSIALTMALIGALAAGSAFSASAQAAPRATTPLGRTAKFLGVWNYRTPEPKTGLNIAAVNHRRKPGRILTRYWPPHQELA